ncbi:uncharacterized protein HMPREF1541_04156 [Cyphellophora europaea CBS 101466]|uniref:non-specific serine/threonine protein kinase n=1 Tax=Cyphellophora europaea (strain CBS 101466) TaxID=1220924 RepID=W2S0V2_CYPE1|nr:uncharacterized protein HMPREF1541_04156 [Cyphellophora europaea CBS 101466]ETN42215.1 hypothetical protein HMPREF1541_04156 [Cyphellophora europaea CBS 101466]
MGQGYSMTTLSAASATIDVPELADLAYDRTLAPARFMKSVRARGENGYVYVRAFMKPHPNFDVQRYIKRIREERNALADIPNALGYQRIVEVATGGFLVRQYVFSSSWDRVSTRPFLEDIEKKWLAYQLLCAVRDSHARDIYHGDIKSENVLVTSWNWLYLTDFSSCFKPTTLPEDNPADFSFYFDTSGRRTCYIAPERFTTSADEEPRHELNWAMDMFSVGCVIAEIFLESPIFSLSQIFKYRSGDYSPEHTHVNKIVDSDVRDMVLNLIDLDPEKRYNADQHLSFYKGRIFPEYFESFLHQYVLDLTESTNAQHEYGLDASNLLESDEKIDRVWQDFDKISYFLEYDSGTKLSKRPGEYTGQRRPKKVRATDASPHDGTLIFLTVVSASIRCSMKASSRLKACDLLVAFAERLPDEIKLDRVVPYIVTLLTDESDIVQASAVRALSTIFEMVEVVSPINAFIFPEYIFPRLKILARSRSTLVRAAYASCLASLALSSARILDMVQAIRADGRLPALNDAEWTPSTSFHALYDPSKEELVKHFEDATVALITDDEATVKRALLGSVSSLCVFFGSAKANDVILTHLNTYLNEKDWILKCSFFDALVGIASYVGTSSLEKFILPIMVGSLTDPEGFVVEKVFRSLARMADLGLMQKSTVWELVAMSARFLVHPSIWIRESAVQFIVLCSRYTPEADKYCIILPILQSFLKTPMIDFSEAQLLDHLKKPLPRSVFQQAELWAEKKSRSLFWTAASRDGAFVLSEQDAAQSPVNFTKRPPMRIPPSQKDKDDQSSLETLKNVGMTPEDEMKLLALREYILRTTTTRNSGPSADEQSQLKDIISLHTLGVRTQNILFDLSNPVRPRDPKRPPAQRSRSNYDSHHTLADALLDASTTIGGPPSRQSTQAGTPIESTQPLDIRGRNPRQRPEIKIDGSDTSSREVSTSNKPSSSELDKLSLRRGKLELRHRNSAMSLMKRDSGKADAEISTSDEMAFGKVDGPLHHNVAAGPSTLALKATAAVNSRSKSPLSRSPTSPAWEPNHSYGGNDPNVLRLLDHHFADNYHVDTVDFGEEIKPIGRMPIHKAADLVLNGTTGSSEANAPHYEPWRPTGQVLTHFSEHTAAINQVCASSDQAFFVTASDDGSCKIWDTMRLEKNITPRSRHTYRHASGAKVKALCFVQDSHTFISAADDGSIHAVRVEQKVVDGGESTKYGRPALVRDWQIPSSQISSSDPGPIEHAIQLFHYRKNGSQSILVAATSHNRLLLIELKTMTIMHSLHESLHHGSLTAFVVDRHRHWLLTGTSHGTLSLYDLRFRIRLRSITLPTRSRVDRLVVHPSKGYGKWVMASSAGEISVWDIDKLVCREVYRPYSWESESSRSTPYVHSTPSSHPSPSSSLEDSSAYHSSGQLPVPALLPVLDFLHPHTSTHTASAAHPLPEPSKYALLFTAGADRALRYWDLPSPEDSYIVSGPMIHSDDSAGLLKARYTVSHPLALSSGAQVMCVQESEPDIPTKPGRNKDVRKRDKVRGGGTPQKARGGEEAADEAATPRTPRTSTPTAGTTPVKAGTGGAGAGRTDPANKPTRNTLLANFGQHLLSTHMDGITDVMVLRRPYGIVVTVDRGGGVMCFQ